MTSLALRQAAKQLREAGLVAPQADARLLLAHVLAVDPVRLLLADAPDADQQASYAGLVARRAAGVPLQHLTGESWFRTIRVAVGPGVFIPRPETEVMTGWAIDRLRELVDSPDSRSTADNQDSPVVVELCAGSAAISLAIDAEVPGCEIHAVELSPEAYAWAERNVAATAINLVQGDFAGALPELDGRVDLVICNPPYIPLTAYEHVTEEVRRHEPDLALFSGDDGLDAMRVLARVAARLLRPGGWLAAEHAELQEKSAPAVFVAAGDWDRVRDHRDLTDRPRFVTAQRRGKPPARSNGRMDM